MPIPPTKDNVFWKRLPSMDWHGATIALVTD